MAKKTNCVINGKEYYRIYRKVGMKVNKMGIWVDDRKAFYGSCKREAEERYHEYMERKKTGQSVTVTCLGQVIEQWIEEVFKHCDLANSTKAKYISAYKRLLQPSKLAGMAITEITAMDIQKFYNQNSDSEASIKSVHNLLRRFFAYAELNNLCRDITHSVTPPKRPKIAAESDVLAVDVWKDDDLKKLISEMGDHRLRLLVIMAINTGCRIAELLALTYDDIKNDQLYISKQLSEVEEVNEPGCPQHIDTLKSYSSNRIVPLSQTVINEIAVHSAMHKEEMLKNGYRTEYLFTTANGTWYYKRNIVRALKRLYSRIGVPYHKFHAFRATFGTNLSRAGVPIEETAKLMGHSDISITAKYYIDINADRKRAAVEKIAGYSLK